MKQTVSKDPRFDEAKKKIVEGQIKSIFDLLKVVPATPIAKATGINVVRLNSKLEDVTLFTVKEMVKICSALRIDFLSLAGIFNNEMKANKKRSPVVGIKEAHKKDRDAMIRKAKELFNSGKHTKFKISQQLGISRSTLDTYLAEDNLPELTNP